MIDLEAHIRRVVLDADPFDPEYSSLLASLGFVEEQNRLRFSREQNGPVMSEADARARNLGVHIAGFLRELPGESRLDQVIPGSSVVLSEEWAQLLSPYQMRDRRFVIRSLNVARKHGSRIERGQREVFPITSQSLSTLDEAAEFDFLRHTVPGAGNPTVYFLDKAFRREDKQLLLPISSDVRLLETPQDLTLGE